MSRLADPVDGVIGADTHRDTFAAAATDRVGGTLAQTAAAADLAGYRRLLSFGQAQVPRQHCWAVGGRPWPVTLQASSGQVTRHRLNPGGVLLDAGACVASRAQQAPPAARPWT